MFYGLISLVLHTLALGLITGFASANNQLPRLSPTPSKPRPSILGIEKSQAITMTWVGFETPTEHKAEKSEIEQAALSPEQGQITPTPPATSQEQKSAQTSTDSHQADKPQPHEIKPQAEPSVITTSLHQPAPDAISVQRALRTRLRPLIAVNPENSSQSSSAKSASEQSTTPQRASEGQSADTTQTPISGGAARQDPGVKSKKESIATALKKAIKVEPGKPVAAQGLDITTVRPRWSDTTRVLASPRNPVVSITFGKNGLVSNAEFMPGLDAGGRNLNEPLLNAIYRWKAKGKALDKLAANDPDAGVTLIMRIILH